MWFSDEPWAWAAYHYGRWTYNPYYGWVWIPGYEWAPAWVSWRTGGGYYGWAPLGPGQQYGGYYDYPDNYWVFVNPNYLYNPYVYNYYERGDMGSYVRRTEYVRYQDQDGEHGGRRRGDSYGSGGGATRYYGPRREDIERETGQPVQVYRVSNARSAGEGRMGGNEINIYRPPVNRESEHDAHPSNVIEGRDHPIGRKQEPVAPNHETAPPAFRQEHQQQPDRQQPPREQPQPQPQQQQHQQFQQQPQREQPQPQQHQQFQQPQQKEQPQQQQRQQPQPQQHGAPQQQQKQQPQPQQQKGQQRGGQQRTKPQQQSERK
jgi:hypothetical protein